MINISINSSIVELTVLLTKYNILFENEDLLNVTKAGEGNMNVVLRIKTNRRSFIFKQSRPYVQKYQDIPAPIDRIDVEYSFYNTTSKIKSKDHFPKIINYTKEGFFMIIEDLGVSEDYSSIYKKRKIDKASIIKLAKILKDIHSCKYNVKYPLNSELKKLNHQHIFILPFIIENGFSLDSVQPGLENLAHSFINNEFLKNKSIIIGDRYLKKGSTLLHGDFYPGSWIQNDKEIFIIDPEFSFIGDSEFDLGVFIAHVIITTLEEKYLNDIINYYSRSVDRELVKHYTGFEVIRRIIGLAQLPINLSLDEKEKLLKFSKNLLLN